jgi:hypothetical protein
VNIHFQPKQEQLYNLLAAIGPRVPTIIGGGGAKGGGKSDGARGCALLLGAELGKTYPGITITIVRRVFDDLKKNHIDPMLRKYPELMKYYNVGNREINLDSFRIVFAYAETEEYVKRKFLGGYESAIIIVDEAQQFSEQELMYIQTACRWTNHEAGIPEGLCKLCLLFNPGGKGSAYIKRIFWTKYYQGEETPHSYAFVHIFGWDNFEWFRGQVDITEEAFYAIKGKCDSCSGDNCCRFRIFVTQTSEGKKYNAFPESIRLGYLLGSFDKFSGQYFAEVWDQRLCVLSLSEIQALKPFWWTTWMSSDYGMGHYWSTFWAVIGRIEPSLALSALGIDTQWPLDIIIVYRELVPPPRTPEAEVAHLIVKATPREEVKELVRWVMGSDVNATPRFSEHSIVEMIEQVTAPAGFPKIRNARCGKDTRVLNARVVWEMLRRTVSMRSGNPPQEKPDERTYPLLFISAECPKIQAAIPSLIADEDNPADVLKVDGIDDDLYDGLKYLLAEFAAVRLIAPVEVRRAEYMNRAESLQGQYMNQLKFDAEEAKSGVRIKRR